jgi:short-subunit dehydrogenase
MKLVVITGSTRGIGLGLAKEFLKMDCRVVVSGRKTEGVNRVVAELAQAAGAANITGKACDVSDPVQAQALWDFAKTWGGQVDIWINNAGLSHLQAAPWEISSATVQSVVRTNIEGLINGCSVAYREMAKQGYGAIYNMEGLGSDGRKVKGLAVYGTSKAAVRYYSEALIEEARNTPVIIGTLSPGMVLTDLLLKQKTRSAEEWKQLGRVYNLLADKVENVAPWLVKQILANQTHGKAIRYLTTSRILAHLFDMIFRGRNLAKEVPEIQ